jgi:glucose-6-phosphate 1-dehydrogenase
VNQTDHLDEMMLCRLEHARRELTPCTIVIFGASGDLTARKLIPALYHLFKDRQMPAAFRIVGVARREKTDDSFRAELREALGKFSRSQPVDDAAWRAFAANVSYCQGDLADSAAYGRLARLLVSPGDAAVRRNLLFYLAISPSQFAGVAEQLHAAGLLGTDERGGWRRLVVEKPYGDDLASAQALTRALTRFVHERQIFRIDHYLGKETVQNLLMFRFANAIFERLWNRDAIDHVQITVSEKPGVGERGGYYEEAGALRDMVQNHLLQVLALMAMEPPVSLEAEAIRDQKVQLLKSIRPFSPERVARQVVRGQYAAGLVDGQSVPGYRHETKVPAGSDVETYVALNLFIDNWRWSGVPFYLRTGKRLPVSASEVRVQFRRSPDVLFAAQCGVHLDSNSLTLRLQPNEGITLHFNGKVPGINLSVSPVRMHFGYQAQFGAYTPEAYERLLLDALAGDPTLFIRRDELETAWGIVDSIRRAWAGKRLTETESYAAGSWGPEAANALLEDSGRTWRAPQPGN